MLQNELFNLGQFIPLHYHFQMLSDTARMTAFRSAIEQVVTSRHKVVDLGSGTGVMSFFAAKQGASVWAVDYNPALVSASRKFLYNNGVAGQVRVVEADAMHWAPPEPVDLVICEMLHSAMLREKQVQVICAFRDAHFARYGTTPQFLPTATLLGVQPVWQCYDFSGYNTPVPLFQSAYANAEDCYSCGEPAVYKIIDYDNVEADAIEADISFVFHGNDNINALRFITKNLLTVNLYTGKTIDWHSQHIIIPLNQPVQVKTGQSMRITFSYLPGDPIEALNGAIHVEVDSGSIKH